MSITAYHKSSKRYSNGEKGSAFEVWFFMMITRDRTEPGLLTNFWSKITWNHTEPTILSRSKSVWLLLVSEAQKSTTWHSIRQRHCDVGCIRTSHQHPDKRRFQKLLRWLVYSRDVRWGTHGAGAHGEPMGGAPTGDGVTPHPTTFPRGLQLLLIPLPTHGLDHGVIIFLTPWSKRDFFL